ncbi:glycosyl transferase family 1 [Rhodococcoides trifolii]|uniref:Glycosyl transferase family 1 n=1 Tax=Rhodococcoides trifolii TaxID=908250 RepID=A0A917G3S5_9NOCA|nr:glycosyltransferase [Rhodococcus trifolii]GGG21692.1 glycosyl transferase family 1 [Rhodococcus trifolii]
MKRVLIVTREFPPQPGGVGDYCARWIEETRKRWPDCHVTVLCAPWPGRGTTFDGADVVEHEDWTRSGYSALVATARRLQPDDVVFHYVPHMYHRQGLPLSIPLLVWTLQRRVAPVTTVFHEMSSAVVTFRHRVLALPQAVLVMLVASASPKSVVTIFTRARWLGVLVPWVRRRITVIPVSPTMHNLSARDGLPPSRPALRLLHFGSKHPSRDFSMIVGALDALDARGIAYEMRVVGTAAAPDPRAVPLGYRAEPEVIEEILSADIALLPFKDGASGRRSTVANCLIAGVPTVSTRGHDTTPSWYGDALVLARDPAEFADAVVALASDPAARARRGEAAAQWAAENISWSVTGAAWAGVLELDAREPVL